MPGNPGSGAAGGVERIAGNLQMQGLGGADAPGHPGRDHGPAGAHIAVGAIERGVGIGLQGGHMGAEGFDLVEQGEDGASFGVGFRADFPAGAIDLGGLSSTRIAPEAAREDIERLHA